MIALLRNYRIGIKYTVLTGLILAGMALLNWAGAFAGIESRVNQWMNRLTDWGYVGLFIIGLFSNMTLIIMVPYAIPLLTLSMYANSITEVVGLGIAIGIGSGIGEVVSYAVAHTLLSHVDDLEKSPMFRWTRRTINRHPSAIPLFVWLASATPAPDLVIIVPLAMIQYPWRKMVLPMISGKIVQNVVMALVYRSAADFAQTLVSEDINFDMTASFVVMFVMLLLYQIEKARAEREDRKPSPTESQEQPHESVV